MYVSIIQWALAAVLAIAVLASRNAYQQCQRNDAIKELSALHIIFITFTFATAIPVCVIQVHLFFFAKTKLKGVNPAGAFGAQLELAHYRKKHFKVAFVSGIVPVEFVVCILPTSFLFLYKIINYSIASTSARKDWLSFGKAHKPLYLSVLNVFYFRCLDTLLLSSDYVSFLLISPHSFHFILKMTPVGIETSNDFVN